MLDELMRSVLASPALGFKRRTRGAVIEGVGLALGGMAVVFSFVALHLLFSMAMPNWLAALLVALLAALCGGVTVLIGRAIIRKQDLEVEKRHKEGLLGLLAAAVPDSSPENRKAENEAPATLIFTALAAGLILGRSMKR